MFRPTLKIYCHVPFGNEKMAELFENSIVAYWYLSPVGDGTFVGWVIPGIWEFKEHFATIPGVTLFPSVHDTELLSDDHVALLAHAGVVKGEKMKQAARKLHAFYLHASMDPDLF